MKKKLVWAFVLGAVATVASQKLVKELRKLTTPVNIPEEDSEDDDEDFFFEEDLDEVFTTGKEGSDDE